MAHLLRPKRLPGSIVDAFAQSSPSSYASFQIRSFSHHAKRLAITNLEALDASKGDRERVVILGSGWAGRDMLFAFSFNSWVPFSSISSLTLTFDLSSKRV